MRLPSSGASPDVLTIALAKGRLTDETLAHLAQAGISLPVDDGSRKLILTSADGKLRYVMAMARPTWASAASTSCAKARAMSTNPCCSLLATAASASPAPRIVPTRPYATPAKCASPPPSPA